MTVAVISRCGRYRITVAPSDVGTKLDFWHWPFGGGIWRHTGSAEISEPLHIALDRAHDLINTTATAPTSGRLRRGEGTADYAP